MSSPTTALATTPTVEPRHAIPFLEPFRVRDALACGASRRQVRPPAATRLWHGVYVRRPGGLVTTDLPRDTALIERLTALRLIHPMAIPYGATALLLYNVALPERHDTDLVRVLVPHDTTRIRRPGVFGHQTRHMPTPVGSLSGVPLLHPVDHWVQFARHATRQETIEVGDGLMRRHHPLAAPDDVVARLAFLDRTPGAALCRRIWPFVVAGTDSLPETRTRLLLVDAGLPCPAVNVPIRDGHGKAVFYVDMGYEAERIAVEYDGAYHVGDRQQMESDARRIRVLQDQGWIRIPVTRDDLRHEPSSVIRSVEAALILRHARHRG